ncbi:hypothetical protein N9X23_02325 [Flavobacteriales bacterium]|nr:hypothetical protein [Flavobacteriales bacterium]
MAGNGCQQGFRSVVSIGFGGQESASKPPQAICKPLPASTKKVDIETAKYISNYYHRFFNDKENIAHRHLNSLFKLDGESQDSPRYKIYKRKGWITPDREALELIKNGDTEFFINTAKRIIKESGEKIFLNNCPDCGKLARTPKARQCRHCGNKWFDKKL